MAVAKHARDRAGSRPGVRALCSAAAFATALALLLTACTPNPLSTLPKGDWQLVASGPTVRYYKLANSGPERDPEVAVARLESFLADIGPQWRVPDELHYYAFADRETLRAKTGWDMTGRAVIDRDAVVSIYASDAHEVAHVLTAPPGRPLRLANFWLEGIAMYYTWPEVYFGEAGVDGRPIRMGTWQGRSVHAWAQDAHLAGDLPPLTDVVHGNRSWGALDDGVSYPMAGSFTTYLLGPGHQDHERIAALRSFFDDANEARSAAEVALAFAHHLGVTLADAEVAWLAFLEGWDEAALER